MALRFVQVQELSDLLVESSGLVDKLEGRRADYSTAVLAWIKKLESALQRTRLPITGAVATARATLIEAGKGIAGPEVTVKGRPTRRRILDATATVALRRCVSLVEEAVKERQTTFGDAERLAQQLVIAAEAKGIVTQCQALGGSHQAFLECVQGTIAIDPDLANPYLHLTSLVGKYDALVFLDLALPTN